MGKQKDQEWSRGSVQFNVNGKPVSFFIYNNMPNIPGMRLSDAVTNWLARIDGEEDCADKSLCNYINSKDAGFHAYTQAEWDSMMAKIKNKYNGR